MPFLTPDTTDERDALGTFGAQQLRQIATTLQGLDQSQLAATPSASGMSLGALARHAILIGQGILADIAAAPAPGEPVQRTPEQAEAEGGLQPAALRADDTADGLIAELESVADETQAVLREADPETEMPVPDAPWFSGAEQWNVRWRALHLVEEMARHAGHADILRESLDGQIAYALNARAEGQPWPPAGWGDAQE